MTERALQSDAEFFKQRGFGLKIGFGERPALLVIDMLKAFTNPDMMLGANLDAQIAAITPLLEVAHARAIPVIFSTVMYHEADFKDAGIWALKQKGVATLKAGTDSPRAFAPSMPGMPRWSCSMGRCATCAGWVQKSLPPDLGGRPISQSPLPPQEHDRFPYSAIVARPPLRWPDGARVAVWIIP